MTPDDAAYFAEACEAFNDIDPNDLDEVAAVEASYPGLTRDDACNWAIYGFTVQDWLTLEIKMVEIAGYVEQLRAHIEFQNELMESRQRVMEENATAIRELNSNAEPSGQ